MTAAHRYIDTIDTMYPDGYARESLFRSAGEMLEPVPAPVSTGFVNRLLHRLMKWHGRRTTRATLREMTADQLHDIGITKAEARAEISKSWFWD